ncbi:MAG: hypothetical protein JXB13_14715 [Phycisphaerae bacterium]|nr:hypothetical protein [Phycisphaerae bacterium]
MIARIGVICQDRNSFGFLLGLRDRLQCGAELVEPPAAIGKQQRMKRSQARDAWRFFQKQGADLVLRFTDADRGRWQTVQRGETSAFPEEARPLLVCGVADPAPETWLALDSHYLCERLAIDEADLDRLDEARRIGFVKHAIAKVASDRQMRKSEVVAELVRDAPGPTFRLWLGNSALAALYNDCRAAAARAGCDTPNEMDSDG